jgi:signal transduction histidine kinase
VDNFAWDVTAHAALVSKTAQERLAQVPFGMAKNIGQKVSGGIEIDATNEDLANSANITPSTARLSASELGRDLHTVSHRLHSATLDTLGLVPGLTALCREFTARQDIEIDFTSENVPDTVHPDIALCLFRIVQEGLHNLKKHSGARKGQVSLRKLGDVLFLTVYDDGSGFDVSMLTKRAGLGIRSMQGRARILVELWSRLDSDTCSSRPAC